MKLQRLKPLKFITITVLSFILAACSGSAESLERSLREAEAAVAQGDMEAARSVSEHLAGDDNLSQLSASQLARLSIVYMQMADIENSEQNTLKAADLYRRAYKADPDSAGAVYTGLPADQLQYVATLESLENHRNNPVDMSSFADDHDIDPGENDILPDSTESL